MISVKIGDLFESEAQVLVNTVNCVGVMGKGIAAIFKKRYPNMFNDYKNRCNQNSVKLGQPYIYSDLLGNKILNFPTKQHWRSVSNIQDIALGLDYFVDNYQTWGVNSIAFPPLGCGNGGLEWSHIGPLLYQKLSNLPIDIELYAPYGTKNSQLKTTFLAQTATPQKAKGIQHEKLKNGWLAILEVVYQLSLEPHANPVGRTIFQKISYIMTELGIETGFNFKKGSYGPFTSELQSALTIIANQNLVQEQQLGLMTAIVPSTKYIQNHPKIQSLIQPYKKEINKTVDLFSRIKNTDQAEEVATIIFSAKALKQSSPDRNTVSEEDVLNHIMDWKSAWKNQSKQESVVNGIRDLQMLGWLKLAYSSELDIESNENPF